MCTTTALETALRSCIRIGPGSCAAIAVNRSEHIAEVLQSCNDEPIETRILRCVKDGRILAQVSADGPTEPAVTCETMSTTAQILASVVHGSDQDRCVVAMHILANPDPGCDHDCSQPWPIASLLSAAAIFNGYWDPNPCLGVVAVDGYEPISCDNSTPLETLLRMCAAIMPDGSVAWRIQIEA